MAEPYPGAFDPDVRTLSREEMADVLRAGGWTEVTVETVERDATWPSMGAAVASIAGTPFGPHVASLPPDAAADEGHVRGKAGRQGRRTSGCPYRTPNIGRGRK